MFHYNMISLTNKPTRVTRLANDIDHIITNSLTGHNDFKSTIIKTNLSDHFPIVFAIKTNKTTQRLVEKSTYKRSYNEKDIDNLKIVYTTEIGITLKKIEDPSNAYKYFVDIFIDIYDNSFPELEVKVKFKSDQSPWLSKGIAKSSKRNNDFMKSSETIEPHKMKIHKIYKCLSETIKKRSKKKFYSEKLRKFKCDTRKTWSVMKKILGKCTTKSSTLPTKITINLLAWNLNRYQSIN